MYTKRFSRYPLALIAGFALAAGCGSSDGDTSDASPDLPKGANNDGPGVSADAPSKADSLVAPDASLTGPDATTQIDGTSIGMDGAPSAIDGGVPGMDGAVGEAGSNDGGTTKLDVGASTGDTALPPADGGRDAATDGFVPDPAVPIVVNSGATGSYSVGNGTWTLFYFDATAGQIYCISELSDIVRAFVGTSPAVSPSNYDFATDPTSGALAFTAATTARYYIAVAASGGGGSGWIQVADGGQLLALGANSVTLSAPDMDNAYFFRFPVGKGHGYSISIAGSPTTSVSLSVSPRAERATNGQFLTPAWSTSGPLPVSNEAILSTSVDLSYSGYYYVWVHVYAALTTTITITQTS
jgi:hypothetical protein